MSRATAMVHWPGQDTPACDRHTDQLKAVGRVMGFAVSATPLSVDVECTNCQNGPKTPEPRAEDRQ